MLENNICGITCDCINEMDCPFQKVGILKLPKKDESVIEYDFETEYQLQEFREIQKDHFDEDGKAFRNVISVHLCERMLKLINQLESELS